VNAPSLHDEVYAAARRLERRVVVDGALRAATGAKR
jgi:hypothetical protein